MNSEENVSCPLTRGAHLLLRRLLFEWRRLLIYAYFPPLGKQLVLSEHSFWVLNQLHMSLISRGCKRVLGRYFEYRTRCIYNGRFASREL